jgi:hypothetical protein
LIKTESFTKLIERCALSEFKEAVTKKEINKYQRRLLYKAIRFILLVNVYQPGFCIIKPLFTSP